MKEIPFATGVINLATSEETALRALGVLPNFPRGLLERELSQGIKVLREGLLHNDPGA
jgi:hypothetical protein